MGKDQLCIAKVSNAEVLQELKEKRSILNTVQLKLRWIGHILTVIRHVNNLRP